MNIFLISISVIFLIFNLYKIVKGYLYYAPSFLISLYSVFIALASMNLFDSDFANFWSNSGIIKNEFIVSMYTIFILLSYQFFTFFSEITVGKTKISYENFFYYFKENFSNDRLRLFSLSILLITLLYLCIVDLDLLWYNKTYLFTQSIDVLKYKNIFFITIQMLIPLIGLMSVIGLGLSIRLKDTLSFILIICPATFFFLLKVGDHSRFSAVYAGVLAVFFLVSKNKIQKFIIAPLFIFIFFGNLINSLIGREQINQGFSSIKDYFHNILYGLTSGDGQTISNLFEGAFVHGEAPSYIDHVYPMMFKILSLSPFPNFLDGYQENASKFSLRLNEYVPMGATGEILIFGFGYMFIYFLIIFFSIRASILAIKKNRYFIFIFSLFLICLASYLQFTYPLRNVLRFFYIAIIVFYLADFLKRASWGRK